MSSSMCSLTAPANPVEDLLRTDRMPHIWCPGCGIGTTVNCFSRALIESKTDLTKLSIVSGIGCTGRVAGYVNLDSFHTTHGRAIPFATGLKLANPDMKVVVYSGDGDLFAIGGNHLIHAARRNVDLKVICVNNLTYAMTGGQTGPATPLDVITATAPYGTYDPAFNLPYLVEAAGAVYVARWTTFHVKQLARSMAEMFSKKGFGFIEVHLAVPDAVSAPQQDGRRAGHHEVLQADVQDQAWSSHQRSGTHQERRNHRGQVRGPRAPRLYHHDARLSEPAAWRRLHPGGGSRMQLTEIRIAGFGGQGVIMCAQVIGRAASIVEHGFATMTQNFGPEARGGACSAQLILSPDPILYPYVVKPDLMVLMSQEAFVKFHRGIKPGGTLIVEQELVRVQDVAAPDVKVFAIPATRIAENLGKKMVQNIVMTGFFGAISGCCSVNRCARRWRIRCLRPLRS